jgi:hypothetical protein
MGLMVLFASLVALGIAGALWGRDSRDCGDWTPDARARALRR